MSLVEEAVKMLESQRAGVIAEIENTPEEDLDYRISDDARTVGRAAIHFVCSALGSGAADRLG